MTIDNPDVTEGRDEADDGNVKNRKQHDESELPLNPFDPERLRLSQDFVSSAGVEEVLLTVPVQKPAKTWFIRTNPDPGYRMDTAIIELKDDNLIYLVSPELRSALQDEPTFGTRKLITCITKRSNLFIWPIRLPGEDGRMDSWTRSSLEIASQAEDVWCRVASDMQVGSYKLLPSRGDWSPPIWPKVSFAELLQIAFKDRYIDSMDHPILRQLRGE